MLHIVHVITDLDTGGAEVMLAKLVNEMDRRLFSNTIISLTDRGSLGDQIERSGVAVHALDMKRGWPDILALPRLIKMLKQLKPAVVQSWLYHADFMSTLARRWTGASPLVWNVRCSNMDLDQYSRLTRLIQWLLARQSSQPAVVVVNSEAGRLLHEQLGYRPRRWRFIPNGFDTHRFRPDMDIRRTRRKEWQVADDDVVIALIARLDPMKDHVTFLEAAQLVCTARQHVRFILVGKDTETLGLSVAQRGLADRVRLLGYRSDIESVLPGVDLVCLSSAFGEGFPNVLGEAMACGIPCVSTDVGDARKIIGDTGLIVPVRNPTALAHAILELIDQGPAVRASLGRAARQRIENTYSLSKIVEEYTALYSELVRQHHVECPNLPCTMEAP